MTLADRIAVLRDGRCEQFAAPLDLYNAPANEFVAGFIGSPRMNFLKGAMGEGGSITLATGGTVRAQGLVPVGPAVAPGEPVTLGVRPEHLRLTDSGSGDADLAVELTEQLGGESYVYGAMGETKIVARLPGQTRIKRGEKVGLDLAGSAALHVFDGAGAARARRIS
jgi:multiple sugar transport system ATP-binding protein